jgi:effector-binding domain-containing protein
VTLVFTGTRPLRAGLEAESVYEEPKIEYRAAEPYVGTAETVTMEEVGPAIGRGLPALFGWLQASGLAPTGAPFVRYLHVDMPTELTIEVAVPVHGEPPADDRRRPGLLPAGRYVTLVHVGPYDGLVAANAEVQRWAGQRGIAWAMDEGGQWGGRVERYLTDPSQQPDSSQWRTEIAYLIGDD